MQLEHEFHVPVPIAQAWDVLLDVERIAPCMPGASVESFDGENVEGKVKVKVGPIQVTYAGTARFHDKDVDNHRIVIDAKGKEARGSGTAAATIHTQLYDEGGEATRVTVTTDLAITGKPAQFGRGVMVEVGNKLIGRFADCLAEEISAGEHPEASGEAAGGAGAGGAGADAAAAVDTAVVDPGGSADDAAAGVPAGSTAADGESVAAPDAPVDEPAAQVAAATASPQPQATPAPPPTPRVAPVPRPPRPENAPLDLLDAAGPAVAKRLVPLVVGLLVLLYVWRRARR
jgi:carbon monoxide dehydrogenase subunit G